MRAAIVPLMMSSMLLLAAISGCDARRIGLNDDDDDDDDENKIPKPLVTTSTRSSDSDTTEIIGLDKVREIMQHAPYKLCPVSSGPPFPLCSFHAHVLVEYLRWKQSDFQAFRIATLFCVQNL